MRIFKKEKRVVGLVTQHLAAVEECLGVAGHLLDRYITGDLDGAKQHARKVDAAESEADRLRHEIREGLYAGAYLPSIRGDIHNLVESVDRVANGAEDCSDFFMMQRPEIPEELREAFAEIVRESFKIVQPLTKAMAVYFKPKGKIKDVLEKAVKVSEQESVVDTQEWELTRRIFRSSLDLSQKLHLKAALDHIVEVADRAEDAADQLELASLKSVL